MKNNMFRNIACFYKIKNDDNDVCSMMIVGELEHKKWQ
jgi:hypothetical protein